MNMNNYQDLAKRTINPDLKKEDQLLNAALGLAGESGEVADMLKKAAFHGHTLDGNHLIKELGDILWYVCQAATAMDLTLEMIAVMNIEKLEKRYPNGFNHQDSINRKD